MDIVRKWGTDGTVGRRLFGTNPVSSKTTRTGMSNLSYLRSTYYEGSESNRSNGHGTPVR